MGVKMLLFRNCGARQNLQDISLSLGSVASKIQDTRWFYCLFMYTIIRIYDIIYIYMLYRM